IFKGKIQGLFDNYYRLERLTASQARDAIERPVKKVGFRYEEGLVEHILHDLTEREQQQQEGAFSSAHEGQEHYVEPPYLQIVCQKLWETEQHNPQKFIRTKTYTTLQGAEQIVKGHVEQVMEKLTLREQALAFQMFQYLVTSRGTKMAYRDEDLADTLGVPVAEVRPILEHLAGRDVRILRLDNRPDGQWYELYHDVFADIIRGWTEQFRGDENRHIYSQIATATREWQQQGQAEDALFKGGLLTQAETWTKNADRKAALLPKERAFLDLSLKKHYRGVWLQRGIVALITLIAIIAGGLAWYAFGQRKEAAFQSIQAQRREQEAIVAKEDAEKQKREAITAKEEAERQSKLARSRQLAMQANNLLDDEGGSNVELT
ncbi:MAG: hypothetical protein GY792_04005, partial [Gammaproteobacteria bacterium]|nr:hypothetical protein [Gammaproteobacteria bacterium]